MGASSTVRRGRCTVTGFRKTPLSATLRQVRIFLVMTSWKSPALTERAFGVDFGSRRRTARPPDASVLPAGGPPTRFVSGRVHPAPGRAQLGAAARVERVQADFKVGLCEGSYWYTYLTALHSIPPMPPARF